MTIIDWPATLVPLNIDVRPPRKTASMTESLDGSAQLVPEIRPPFGLTMQFDTLFGSEILAWRALMGLLEGRANVVRVPIYDPWFAASAAEMYAGGALHSDGTSFSDETAYLTSDIEGVLVTGVQGQRTITADFGDYGQLLDAGLYFGLGEYPYLCTGIEWAANVATIRCTPTLRIAYTAEPLKLRPSMLCRLADDDGGDLPLRSMRTATPSIEFVEALL